MILEENTINLVWEDVYYIDNRYGYITRAHVNQTVSNTLYSGIMRIVGEQIRVMTRFVLT